MKATKRTRQALWIGSLVLALLAQYYLAEKRDFMWDGIVLYGLAMLLFAILVTRGRASKLDEGSERGLLFEIWQLMGSSAFRLGALALGVTLTLYVAFAADARKANNPYYDLLALWAGGVALITGAFVNWRGLPRRFANGWKRLGKLGPEAALVGLLIIASFLTRFLALGLIPRIINGDEASFGLEAIGVLEGRRPNPFTTGWMANPVLYSYLQAAFLRLFGNTASALRLPSALVSAATAALLYLFVRRYFGRWAAILAGISFATYHYAIHYGRLAYNNIWDPFFALGATYFLSRGLEEKRIGSVIAAAVITGLSVYFHAGSRVTILILLIYLVYWALRERGFAREQLPRLILFALVAVAVAAPLLRFFQTHPNDMMAPWTRKAIFPSGWVESTASATGQSVFSILLTQFLKSALAFNYSYDPTFHYHPQTPLLQFLPSVFFVYGLAYAILNWRERRYFLIVLWLLIVVIFGGTLLENPPSSNRLLLAIPPVLVCFAVGVVEVTSFASSLFSCHRATAMALALALTIFSGYQSARFYFVTYAQSYEFAGLNTYVADRMGWYLQALGPDYQCYFFGAPRMYYDFPNIRYLARGVAGQNIDQPVQGPVAFVNPNRDAVFIFLPERRGELDVVLQSYPSGRLREFMREDGQLLFVSYEVEM